MKKVELVFIPCPGLSHLVSTVETAKLLLHRDGRLAITVLIMKLPNDTAIGSYTQKTSSPRLRLLDLPGLHDDGDAPSPPPHIDFIDKQTTHVRETISNLINQVQAEDSQLAGLVLDMFCTKFVEIGRAFGLHSYVFFTSSAAALGLSQHLVGIRSEHNQTLTRYRNSDEELSVPYYRSPVPARVLPADLTAEGGAAEDGLMRNFMKIREAKGIMVNTFYELESYAIDALNSDGETPKVYPVGPVFNQSSQEFDDDDEVKKWLDDQDEKSVVFLCFGTMGRLDEAQVREMALALEKSGCRFLWSLRNLEEVVLPEGFLERTKGVGKVIKWAAQVAVLAHAAVGGFVSHCGWNSTLESVWFGVPIATFPLYAEQQINAFLLVKELGMAEMIRVDYNMGREGEGPSEIVGAEEIEAAIRRLMAAEGGSGVREKVEEMQRKARAAVVEGKYLPTDNPAAYQSNRRAKLAPFSPKSHQIPNPQFSPHIILHRRRRNPTTATAGHPPSPSALSLPLSNPLCLPLSRSHRLRHAAILPPHLLCSLSLAVCVSR